MRIASRRHRRQVRVTAGDLRVAAEVFTPGRLLELGEGQDITTAPAALGDLLDKQRTGRPG
ncbi:MULTISPECIES: hypothetical protein [Streptomyces]|uniref:Uncharacterized protein n=2 Tax=Streptomyces TaxID=1883 RepID=A0ABV9J5A4_9ACTN